MNIIYLKSVLSRTLINVPGKKINRKIIVIESDDWGSIRMASKKAYDNFFSNGLPVDSCPYNRNDALESNEDLECLFDVLSSFRDKNGNPAILTANMVTANPWFEKIRDSGFSEYHYEPFIRTLDRYPSHDKVYQLYLQGIRENIIKPQFHGREHLNVSQWMKALRNNDKYVHNAFGWNMFSLHYMNDPVNKFEYMDAMNFDSVESMCFKEKVINEGLKLFSDLWGYKSKSFIAPCYIWDSNVERILFENGVTQIQGVIAQKVPDYRRSNKCVIKYNLHGSKNGFGQIYINRNCFFEPSQNIFYDWIDDCMARIKMAFKWKNPAIISSHRVNYIGFLNKKNQMDGLMLLKKLLINIQKEWPDIEYLSSDKVGDLYE